MTTPGEKQACQEWGGSTREATWNTTVRDSAAFLARCASEGPCLRSGLRYCRFTHTDLVLARKRLRLARPVREMAPPGKPPCLCKVLLCEGNGNAQQSFRFSRCTS